MPTKGDENDDDDGGHFVEHSATSMGKPCFRHVTYWGFGLTAQHHLLEILAVCLETKNSADNPCSQCLCSNIDEVTL